MTKYVDKCLVIQKHWRRFVARRALTALRVAARIVQTSMNTRERGERNYRREVRGRGKRGERGR